MNAPANEVVSTLMQRILDGYPGARAGEGGNFGSDHPVYQMFEALASALGVLAPVVSRPHIRVKAGAGQGNWARVPWVALMDERETTSTQKGVYGVLLFRQDATGVYVTFNQRVTELKRLHGTVEAREILKQRAQRLHELLSAEPAARRGFQSGDIIDLVTNADLGRAYEHSTASCKLYESGRIPSDFEIAADLEVVLAAYERYMESELRKEFAMPGHDPPPRDQGPTPKPEAPRPPGPTTGEFDRSQALTAVLTHIRTQGFIFEPWQVAQYVTALRTKPLVILAGVTGTGKSRLPRLVEDATGGVTELVAVRPDWTDSSEILGYVDLEGRFRPGRVLEVAHQAFTDDDVHHTLIIDEMNLARVEHYFAEILSRIEDRRPHPEGGWQSLPLVQADLRESDGEWGAIRLPRNLGLVGTVNMDESAHGFSRKVLDRAFTVELSDVNLEAWDHQPTQPAASPTEPWPIAAWWPRATRLSELGALTEGEREIVSGAIQELVALNQILSPAQLQVGYRTRDEVALFLLHAQEIRPQFVTTGGEEVSPLDLAIQMKVLPRIAGGNAGVRQVLLGLLGWGTSGTAYETDDEAQPVMEAWTSAGRPGRMPGARLPGVAGRACLMWERLNADGFTSYWL
jgi:hypothetical protein